MTRQPLWIPPGGQALVEVSNRTIQGRFLLLPTPEVKDLILGVVGRAQRMYQMQICLLVFLSNHYHMLLIPRDAEHLASFMNFVGGEIGRKISRLHGWNASVWAGRYRPILISDEEEVQLARFRYLLSQGVKEGLVNRPEDWIGVHGVDAWLEGKPLEGHWFDQTRASEAARRGEEVRRERFSVPERVSLTPLPCWSAAGMCRKRIRQVIRSLVEEVSLWTRAEQRLSKSRGSCPSAEPVAGERADGQRIARLLSSSVDHRPPSMKKTPCPVFIARSKGTVDRYRESLTAFWVSYREASRALRSGARGVRFPPGSFPPAGPFFPPAGMPE